MPDSILEKYLENAENSAIKEWPLNSFKYQLLKMIIEESAKGKDEASEVIMQLSTNLAKSIFMFANQDLDISYEGIDAVTADMKSTVKQMSLYMKNPEGWTTKLACGMSHLEAGVVDEDGKINKDKLSEHLKTCKECREFMDVIKGKRK